MIGVDDGVGFALVQSQLGTSAASAVAPLYLDNLLIGDGGAEVDRAMLAAALGTPPTSSVWRGRSGWRRNCARPRSVTSYFSPTAGRRRSSARSRPRRHHAIGGAPKRTDVIGFQGSFHGRTYAAINAAGNPFYLDGFGPALPGCVQLTLSTMRRRCARRSPVRPPRR